MTSVDSGLLVTLVSGISAAVGAGAASLIVPWRVTKQPLPVDVDGEATIIRYARSGHAGTLGELVSEDWFTHESRRASWVAAAGETRGADMEDHAELERLLEDTGTIDPGLRNAVISVAVCAEDRAAYQGAAVLEQTGESATPFRWRPAARTTPRVTASALLGGAAAAGAAGFVYDTVGWLGVTALILWLLTGVVLAWVDIDTLFIDTPTVAVGYGLAGATAAFAGWSAFGVDALWLGGVAVAVSALFVLFVTIYSRIRGIDGMGGGDFIILPALVAVPLWLGADLLTIAWAILASAVVAVATWAVTSRGRENRRQVPFPFGPGLIIGFAGAFTVAAALS